RASLRAAGDGPLRRRRHRAGIARPLHPVRRDRCAGRRTGQGEGDFRLMSELRDLYQEVILDHNRQPRNFRCPKEANREARDDEPDMGKLAVLAGVREYPMRVKCATLSWHTLNAALNQAAAPQKTEPS